MSGPRSVLVRGPNWLGDLVMATPGFRALRAAWPQARLVLQVRRGLEPLLDGAPWFDAVVALDDGPRGLLSAPRRARSLWRQGRALRGSHGPFDLGICLPDSFSSAALMRAAGVRRIVGYRRGGRSLLLHQAVSPPRGRIRPDWVARERWVLGLLEAAGVPDRGTRLELYTTEEEEARADALLAGAGLDAKRPLVVLAPGAGYGAAKRWPAERFAAVGDAAAEAGAAVALAGGPGEAPVTAAVRAAMRRPAVDLAGRLDPGVLKALVRRARAVVANDAGARHVAVAFRVPTVVVFGPTAVAKTDCNLEGVRVLEAAADCRPCYRRECPIDHRCMTRIEAAPAVEAVRDALAGRWVAPA